MQPVVVPPRSSQTRSVFALFLVRLSGYGIFTDVTRLMTLRTSSRSAAETGMHATPDSRIASVRHAGFWSIWTAFLKGGASGLVEGVNSPSVTFLNLAATRQDISR